MTTARWIVLSVFLLLTALLLAAVLTPSLRMGIQQRLGITGREVLATAEGDLLNDGSQARVIKFRDRNGIFVEVLRVHPDGSTTAVDRVVLPDRHDGLFNYQGHITRLAIIDVDEDGKMELLAPSFDHQLVPHLNVFRYNADIGRFEPYSPTP